MSGNIEAILETGAAAAVTVAASALAERGHALHPCPNCDKPMIGDYCGVCGQERNTHRRSILALAEDLVDIVINLDSRVVRTSWALLARPGEIAKAFREGRTRRYLPALRLYFFVSLIFFLVLNFTNIALMQLLVVGTPAKVTWIKGEPYIPNPAYEDEGDIKIMPRLVHISKAKATEPGGPYTFSTQVYFFQPIGTLHSTLPPKVQERLKQLNFNADIEAATDSAPAAKKKKARDEIENGWIGKWLLPRAFAGMRKLAADPAALNEPMTTWIPRVLFLLMPIYALLLALFYVRQRKTFFFVDHLIFSLTIHAFGFVLLLLAAGAAQLLPGDVVALGTLLIGGVYTLIATRNFYGQSWIWTAVKFAMVSFVYVCFFVLPALGGVIAWSFLNA